MRCKILFLTLLSTCFAYSQGEANIWYFGVNAGLDFNSGVPVALHDGQLDTNEGCASVANASGQLLFYTDGVTIYNKNHQIMQNGSGLLGDYSTTQSATIVPLPGSTSLYYVFTLDDVLGQDGFRYSIVDISLDGGLGAVTSAKNILLYTPSCEKMAVIKNANSTGFWIVTHGKNNNNFYVHHLTASGINNPTIINIGFVPTTVGQYCSYMKISPDGSKLAVAFGGDFCVLELYDFNNNTGSITNELSLFQGTAKTFYGVEFSPNSKVLYSSDRYNQSIYQYDLTASDIINSVVTFPNIFTGALQLGPDGKMYFCLIDLCVINNPNIIGVGCDIQLNTVVLSPGNAEQGLPSFVQSIFYSPAIQLTNNCVDEQVNFSLNSSFISTNWNFGDNSTSTAPNPTHSYSNAGTYTVVVTTTNNSGTSTNTRDIIIYPKPTLITSLLTLKQCDDNIDGFSNFNLNETIPLLVSNPADLTVTFHETQADADDNDNAIANFTAYTNQIVSNDIVFVRVENSNGCYKTAQINLVVSTTLIPSSFQIIKTECDDLISGSKY